MKDVQKDTSKNGVTSFDRFREEDIFDLQKNSTYDYKKLEDSDERHS